MTNSYGQVPLERIDEQSEQLTQPAPLKSGSAPRLLPTLAVAFLLVVLLVSLILGLNAVHRLQSSTAGPSIPPVNIYAGEGFNLIKLQARTGKQLWTHTIPTSVDAMPVVANGVVYLASHSQVYALDARDASVLWHMTLPELDSQPTIPVVAGGVVYLGGSEAGAIYALDALTGKQRWLYHFADQSDGHFTISDLTVVDGILYGSEVHTVHHVDSSSFFALAASTGNLLWRIPAEQGELFATSEFSAPVVSAGAAYVVSTVSQDGMPSQPSLGDAASYLSVLNAQTGKVLWRTSLEGEFSTPPMVANGVVYLATTRLVYSATNKQILQEDGTLAALRASDGTQLWHYQAPASLVVSPQVLGGLLYLGTDPSSGSGTIIALDASTGAVRWQWVAPSYIADQLIVVGGVLLVGVPDSLYALNAATGAQVWRARTIIPIGSSLALLTVAP